MLSTGNHTDHTDHSAMISAVPALSVPIILGCTISEFSL